MSPGKKSNSKLVAKFNFTVKEIIRYDSKVEELIKSKNFNLLEAIKVNLIELDKMLKDAYINLPNGDEMYEAFVENQDLLITMLSKITNALRCIEMPELSTCKESNTKGVNQSNLNLPRFDLPTFYGELHNWLSFKEIFLTSIGQNCELTDLQRLQYLQASVKGDAARLIKGFAIIGENYSQAWETLVSRYDNKRELAFAQITKFFSIKHLKSINAHSLHELLDVSNEALRNIDTLGFKRNSLVEMILIHSLQSKLDESIRHQWELLLEGQDIPTYNQFIQFLEKQARSLQASKEMVIKQEVKLKAFPKKSVVNNASVKSDNSICAICNQFHQLHKCQIFLEMTLEQRWNMIKKHNLCINCLRNNHFASKCLITTRCKACNAKHHSLLHAFKPQSALASSMNVQNFQPSSSNIVQVNEQTNPKCFTSSINDTSQTLLSTVVLKVKNSFGQFVKCRALVDNGSQKSLISKVCCKKLHLHVKAAEHKIYGINNLIAETALHEVQLTFTPHFNDQLFDLSALVVDKITTNLPNFVLPHRDWPHLNQLILADPNYHVSDSIDILIGADMYANIILGQPIHGPKGSPTAINSKLGWLLSGSIFGNSQSKPLVNCHALLNLENEIKKFWEIESVSNSDQQIQQDECEQLFQTSFKRDGSGRYIVNLPFKSEVDLGESKSQAMRRFIQLENKLNNDSNIKAQYIEFMKEYLELNHMSLVPTDELNSPTNQHYYLPHHYVLKENNSTTKLRVVFDASAKTSKGNSLNDCLHIGPKLQSDLFKILVKFRSFPVALCADIEKMYRQIRVVETHTDYQRILWRFDQNEPIQTYRLLTVTYGTASAPYLAIKTLQQLAKDEEFRFPDAAKVTLRDFYVDDLLTGANSIQEAKHIIHELNNLMYSGGFTLRKWSSNLPEVLEDVPDELKSFDSTVKIIDHSIKILGLYWNPKQDSLQVQISEENQVHTKRQLLSFIARIFDPLGFLSPVIIFLKIMMQNIWKAELKWDDSIPPEILESWHDFKFQIDALKQLTIPRFIIGSFSQVMNIQLHGFCDASLKAYAAVFYLRVVLLNGEILVNLVAAKTRVSPLKHITLPRLELCAAVLLARLYRSIADSLSMQYEVFLWSDSQIVISWINSNTIKGNQFVQHRVAVIQTLTSKESWNHISGSNNPADCASRGILPNSLVHHKLWWQGPSWLAQPNVDYLPGEYVQSSNVVDTETLTSVTQTEVIPSHDLILKYSSFTRLIRIISWCLRFISNSRVASSNRIKGNLNAKELERSIQCIVKIIQLNEFKSEITSLKSKGILPSKSRYSSLAPFLDNNNILRVGGRLQHSLLSAEAKHPILIPKNHHFTELIIDYYHKQSLHSGTSVVLSLIRQKYWFTSGRDKVRRVLHKCLTCFRSKNHITNQFMGNLPKDRVTPSSPFQKVGIDFAGPFPTKPNLPRTKITIKSYAAIFICFATKAVHLETVSDLSTESFLACLRRFISRRGKPTDIFTDNATNFKGASNYLKEQTNIVRSPPVQNFVAEEFITWHFIPPRAPHFGGLWESNIKSIKAHITKSCKSALLTFEELTTLLIQIEACLNSRPLTSLRSDPDDLEPLTPGHFLIGKPLLTLPERVPSIAMALKSRWSLIQRMKENFWNRWNKEYLNQLQTRPKWAVHISKVQVGDLVILKEDDLPPCNWNLARITKVFPGNDGLIRVIEVKTAKGLFKRPITKICLLPETKPSGDQ